LPSAAEDRRGRRPVVGLGLMEYAAGYSVAGPGRDTYERYLESLALVVRWLLDHEYDVNLLLGDSDAFVVDDFRGVLEEHVSPHTAERVRHQPTGSVHELLAQLSATDFVVATRFHNVLMSLLFEKPVIAISFHHKCSSLMSAMGLADYCHDINTLDADALIEHFQALVRNRDDVEHLIAQGVDESRRALDEQYRRIFEGALDQSRSINAATVAT
jgi:polysaccharide pyruvyl transferase WcaK-like protein